MAVSRPMATSVVSRPPFHTHAESQRYGMLLAKAVLFLLQRRIDGIPATVHYSKLQATALSGPKPTSRWLVPKIPRGSLGSPWLGNS